ncbi:glycosyltransferase family 2 protein [bacterium]|nr:glycosyltransferase family 2 protein [bacterium]
MSLLSVITPAYNEEKNLPVLYDKLLATLDKLDMSWEWIIIDDHSTDDTESVIKQLIDKDDRIKTLRFSKNFGAHAAIKCGFEHAQGDCLVNLAADLQNPPEHIPELVDKWRNGTQVVIAARKSREGESIKVTIPANIYRWFIRNFTELKDVPPKGSDYYLLDRLVIEAILQFKEVNLGFVNIIMWMGFRREYTSYTRKPRLYGKSGWTLQKKVKAAIDTILSFSYFPVRAISYSGIVVAFLGFLYAGRIIYNSFNGHPVQGWSSLMVVILFLSGIQMIMMGVLGEYLWRTNSEVKRRPRYLIEGRYGKFDENK